MRIINPSFGRQEDAGTKAASAKSPTDWLNDPVAIISNSKTNAMELLQGVRKLMGEFRSIDNVDYMDKPSAAHPAPPELVERVINNYRGAIVALAD